MEKNILIRETNTIPLDPFNGKIINIANEKNFYSNIPFVDIDANINTLYCYRIFTEFENSDKFYSGMKNTFFVYVYETNDTDDNIIDNNISIEQIKKWNEYGKQLDELKNKRTYAIDIITDPSHKFISDDLLNKLIALNDTQFDIESVRIPAKNIITNEQQNFISNDLLNKLINLKDNDSDNQINKLNAKDVLVDELNIENFSPNNLEDAIKQLFMFVVDGKRLLASAINDKSGKNEATQQMNFQELANLIYTVDILERQNLILTLNNKFDLKISLDTTFEDINKTLNNMTLDSVRKTFEIQSIMDFSNLNINTILDLSKNMKLTKGEITLDYVMDFSKFNIGVII